MIATIVVPPTNLVAVVVAVTVSAVAMAVVVIPVIVAIVMLVAAVSMAVLVGYRRARQGQNCCRAEAQPPFRAHGNPPK